jgi:hypothetical protein
MKSIIQSGLFVEFQALAIWAAANLRREVFAAGGADASIGSI